jgi:hypothetical protein
LRLKAARKLGITEVPVILCDEWSAAQVKAFRLMVNRSITWASWDEELLALELQELNEAEFDLDLTGFNPGEIDGLLALPDEERANATPPVPEHAVSVPGDLWLCNLPVEWVSLPHLMALSRWLWTEACRYLQRRDYMLCLAVVSSILGAGR